MKATINKTLLSRILFFASVFFITVFFSDWFGGVFFFNRNYRVLKFILCVLVPFLTVIFNYKAEKSLKFVGRSSIIISFSFILFFLLFNFLGIEQFRFYQTASLYHIAYALVCLFSVFACATAIAMKNKEDNSYPKFYNDFFSGYFPVMIMLYILFYFKYRTSGLGYTVNIIPFQGEIKTLFSAFSSQTLMRSLGNIAFYSSIALCAARFIKKHTAPLCFAVSFGVCLLTELSQGIFSIGDADVDDIILNGLGALIGALLYSFVIRDLRSEKLCLE